MECRKCKSKQVIVEGVGEGKVRVTCQQCLETSVIDDQGRQLLTDDMPAADRREYLTS